MPISLDFNALESRVMHATTVSNETGYREAGPNQLISLFPNLQNVDLSTEGLNQIVVALGITKRGGTDLTLATLQYVMEVSARVGFNQLNLE